MPTNLPPEARAKWIKVMEAKTTEEKIKALEDFISSVPKHKGTENLLYWATRRLSQLKEDAELAKKKKTGGGIKFYIEKEGDAQIVMLGPPLSGKTSLLSKLTNAKVEILGYHYSTKIPQPGMLKYMDVYFQLIDTPSIPYKMDESVPWLNRTIGLARNADAIILVLDGSKNVKEQILGYLELLEKAGIMTKKPKGSIEIKKASKGGLNIILNGKIVDGRVEDIKSILKDYKIIHAVVKINGEISLEDIETSIIGSKVYRPTIITVNKSDLIDNIEEVEKEISYISKEVEGVIFTSTITNKNLEKIGELIFKSLRLIRIYTKQPNGDVAKKPLVLKNGATVRDVASSIHSSLEEFFKYAKIWGKSAKYPGERVGLDHELQDGDIVEIYSKV